ncbi:MAG: hypothetical protein A2075_05825 [Geobacteraceae bacterium GWC2_58_44]|nr:MAG: hypothetical protein A2075_05825 [Geobacteraceae bacterium GWC2_58_44]HBG06889.1 hypothetical protein [Geobacter sp.]
MKTNKASRYFATGLAALGLCMAAGCATKDTVSSRFSLVEENINAAKTAGAETYAPDPLKSAEAKLESAKSAVRGNDMVSAARFVDEAMVDADYARAKAPTEKAKNDALKLRGTIQALRAEILSMPAAK